MHPTLLELSVHIIALELVINSKYDILKKMSFELLMMIIIFTKYIKIDLTSLILHVSFFRN